MLGAKVNWPVKMCPEMKIWMEQWEKGDYDDDTGTLQPTICPDSSLWHGINQTSAIFSFPSAVARNDTGRELRGFADARTVGEKTTFSFSPQQWLKCKAREQLCVPKIELVRHCFLL